MDGIFITDGCYENLNRGILSGMKIIEKQVLGPRLEKNQWAS